MNDHEDKTHWNHDAFLLWCIGNGIEEPEDQEMHWPEWKAAYVQGVVDCTRIINSATNEEKEKIKQRAEAFVGI